MASSNWRKNAEAQRRVKELLERAGVPLELKAWKQAEAFRKKEETDEVRIQTEKIVYGQNAEQPPREIDLCTTIYEELELSGSVGIQLMVSVPVECKYREDVEAFGFPAPQQLRRTPRFPVMTSLAGSDLMLLLRNAAPKALRAETLDVSLIKIEGGKTPREPFKEALVYNAGAALYDYVSVVVGDTIGPVGSKSQEIPARLLEQFIGYLQEKHYVWWSVLHKWKRENITTDEGRAYADALFGAPRRPVYTLVSGYVPVVCLEGPLYAVSTSSAGRPKSFRQSTQLVTGLRVVGWPGSAIGKAVEVSPEVAIVVTNVAGLTSVLKSAQAWFLQMRRLLLGAPEDIKERAWLEGAFCRLVRAHFAVDSGDYDIEVFL